MKKLVAFLLVIVAVIFTGNLFNTPEVAQVITTPTASPTNNIQSVTLDVEGISMRINWVEVDPTKVELYSNLTNKQTSAQIIHERNCKTLVNGGFYSKENKHLGLLIDTNGLVSHAQENSLFNGFLWFDLQGVYITTSPPDNAHLAVQTGPVIINDSKPRMLSIKNDEQARRVVAAITTENKLLFLVIYRDGSEFQGPYLEELPKIIQEFSNSSDLEIVNAINLDGGNASAFITDFVNLTERTQIGSYFCVE